MKYRTIVLITIFCLITGLTFGSCTTSYVYKGQHNLNEEYHSVSSVNNTTQPGDRKTTAFNSPKYVIAVIDFDAKNVPYSIALSVSELIRTEMIKSGKYTVIERSQMKEILKEQGFQQTGCTDVACAVKLGKLLSARKMLVGTVMKLGEKLIISGRIIDVEKGIGEKAASGKAGSVDELDISVIDFVNNL